VAFDGHRMIPVNYNEYEFNWNKLLWGFPSFGPSSFEKAKSCKILNDNNIRDIDQKSENFNRCNRFIYKFFYNQNGEIISIFTISIETLF
jgi:hypothetical protein